MNPKQTIRIAVADAKGFERASFRTYVLDEANGVTIVTANDLADKTNKAQTFIFDLSTNPNWDFASAEAYAKTSREDVDKLAAAVKGSSTFKTLAAAAIAGTPVPIDKIRHGLNLASVDPKIYDSLIKASI